MQVDFFVAPCTKVDGNCKKSGVTCKESTKVERFGLCDKNSDKREPAFIDIKNESIWDVAVLNPIKKEVTFKAVDFCVDIFRVGNELIKRCEGFLFYENKVLFIELKNREKGRWLIDAREKFQETILKFRENHPSAGYELLEPIVANKLFFRAHQNEMVQKRILKDNTGLEFHVTTIVNIN